jgi:hypothetical protein
MTNPVVVSSRIDRVQVFRRGAVVTRHAIVDGAVANERGAIEIAGLPLSMLDASARVRVLAVAPSSSAVTATGQHVAIAVKPGLPPPKSPQQEAIDDLSRRIAELAELAEVIELEVELLTSIPVPDRPEPEAGRAPPPAPLAMRLALESFVDDAAEARRLERRTILAQVKLHQRELEALQEEARAASAAAAVNEEDLSKAVIVPVVANGPVSEFVVELRYFVPGARWTPAYHVKLDRDGTDAVIHQRAHIAQRSGEDWTGVKLSLSTASPLRFSELPELASIRIGKAQPAPVKRGFRPPPLGAAQLFADLDRDRAKVIEALPPARAWTRPSFDEVTDEPTSARKHKRSTRERTSITASARSDSLLRSASLSEPAVSMADDAELFDVDLDINEAPLSDSRPHGLMKGKQTLARPSAARSSPQRGDVMRGEPRRSPGIDDVVEAIVFPWLRLPEPDDVGHRGRLVPVDTRRIYAESAARAGRPISLDISRLVERAEAAAEEAGALIPEGCIDIGHLNSNYDFSWDADGVVDVLADGVWHSVPLGDRPCDAAVRYVSVPREELLVYRVAALTNPLNAPMLSGPAEIYVGGEYVLTTKLPMVAARGEFTLGLGVEQAIKIARNARFRELRDGEGVVAMVELVHDVDVEVVNHLSRAIELEVRERVPVAAPQAEVQVVERGVAPAWEAWDQGDAGDIIKGGRRWRVTVEAGATSTLRACYALRVFSNAEIQGGNRREP